MSLDHLIGPNAALELQLLRMQDSEELWLSYAEAVAGDFDRSVFVLDRAVSALPASALLWNAYLSLPWGPENHSQLVRLCKRALSVLSGTPAYWHRLLALLQPATDPESTAELVQALDRALVCLDVSHHAKLWQIYADLAESQDVHSDSGKKLAISVYRRLFEASEVPAAKSPVPQAGCVLKIAELGDYSTSSRLMCRLSPKPDLEFVQQYMKILSQDPGFADDAFFESLAQNAVLDHPSRSHTVLRWLAEYYSDRENAAKARYLFGLALSAADSIPAVVEAFDSYTNWEENWLERYVQDNDFSQETQPELEAAMAHFEAVLGRHRLYISDVLLKQNPNCVDYWLDRIAHLDAADRIGAYVQAIRSINPLDAVSTGRNSLATIWSDYADVYLASGDVRSAEVIYSRALKTPFRYVQDLADLYIKWTELKLGVSDEAALGHVEEVLFLRENAEASGSPEAERPKNKDTEAANLKALSGNLELWKFYLDLLQAVPDSGLARLETAYNRMLQLQLLSLRMLFDYADFLKAHDIRRCYNVYEAGLSQFHSSEAQATIWTRYLHEYMQHEAPDAVHDLYSRCLRTKVPANCAYDIFAEYAAFCSGLGKLVQASRVLRQGIDHLSKADSAQYSPDQRKTMSSDKNRLFSSLLEVLTKIGDDALLREAFSSALEDQQLFLADLVEYGTQFIAFEKHKSELVRVRHLYRHLTSLGHPNLPLFSKIWDAWERFEAQFGDERSFKDVLREKRTQIKLLGDVAELKADINPIGFIKGETNTSKVPVKQDVNPDAIELDMDM